MVISLVRCPILRAHVTQVTDFEGAVARVICPEYDASNGRCRLKAPANDGPLGQLLERVSVDSLDTRATRCVLLTT